MSAIRLFSVARSGKTQNLSKTTVKCELQIKSNRKMYMLILFNLRLSDVMSSVCVV